MLKDFQQKLPSSVWDFCKKVHANGGEAWLVGGWVRDRYLKVNSESDSDIEVFHLTYDQVELLCKDICKEAFPRFGVFKCEGMDLALPRIEHCTGKRYNHFKTILSPHLSLRKAALRRDFTVNTLAWNPISNALKDPFNGLNAIKTKLLYPVTRRFTEDPYRVLRAAQLITRFNFAPSQYLIRLIKTIKSPILAKAHLKRTLDCLNTSPYKDEAWQFLEKIGWIHFFN